MNTPFSKLLRDYQVPHVKKLLASLHTWKAALDGSDTRTGKTYSALAVAKQMNVTPFIICPKVAKPGWVKAAKDMGVDIQIVNFEQARGVSKKENWHNPKVFGPCFRHHAESDYGQEKHFGAKASQWVWKFAFEFVIFDEAHRCGGSKSLNSKMLIAAKRQFGYVLILSATIGEDPTQFKAVGYALGLFELNDFHWWLMAHGCSPGVFGGVTFGDDPWERDAALLAINKEIYGSKPMPRGSRVKKSDIPNFPKTQIDVILLADSEGKVAKLDKELRQAYEGKSLQAQEATHHLTKITKIRQSFEILKIPDLVALTEHHVAAGAKVTIFVNYTETIDRLASALKKVFKVEIPVIDGRPENNKAGQRDRIRAEFQANLHPALVLNAAAGGEGISTYDEAGKIERVQLIVSDYNAKTLKQVLGRPHALGAAFSLQLVLAYEGTLEQEVVEDAVGKLRNLSTVNEGRTTNTL